MIEHGPSRLMVVIPAVAAALFAGALLGLPAAERWQAAGMAAFVGAGGSLGFLLNACRVRLDPEARTVEVRRLLSRATTVVGFDEIAEIREVRGKGSGLRLILREGSPLDIPYSGVTRGRRLRDALRELVTPD